MKTVKTIRTSYLRLIFAVFFLVIFFLFYLFVNDNEKKDVIQAFSQEEYQIDEGFFLPNDITSQVEIGGIELICGTYPLSYTDESVCPKILPFPTKILRDQGYDAILVRGDRGYPMRLTLCLKNIPDSITDAISPFLTEECLRANNINPKELPSPKFPPSAVPPPGSSNEYISIINGGRFRIEGKLPYNQMNRGRRAIGMRITAVGLDSLEESLRNYINTIMDPLLNCLCERRNSDDTCTSCCERNGPCCYTDPITGGCMVRCCSRWCNSGECPPGSNPLNTSPCPTGTSCPSMACQPAACTPPGLIGGHCAAKDSYLCGSRYWDLLGNCDIVGGTNSCGEDRCVDTGFVGIELFDCNDRNSYFCSGGPADNNCNNDSLGIGVYLGQGGGFKIETFSRMANYVANLPGCHDCNNSRTEVECSSSNCNPLNCSCRCCSGSRFCGIRLWPPEVGCLSCDDDSRTTLSFGTLLGFPSLILFSHAFFVYGPSSQPYNTVCGVVPSTYKRDYPGEWINICGCIWNTLLIPLTFSATVCRGGFFTDLLDWLASLFTFLVVCDLQRSLNGAVGNLLKNLGVFPLSIMEKMGACSGNNFDIGVYPELCAGSSLGYSINGLVPILGALNGGSGINVFLDFQERMNTKNSCVIGSCPQYPTQVPASICGNTSSASNVHNCLPDSNSYDIGVYVQQELINELLYLGWTQGYLCQSFKIPPEVAKIVIPGIRQIFPSSTTVTVKFIPVCTNPTPTFQTGGGSSFTINIPEFMVEFTASPSVGPPTNLFDLRVSANVNGVLGRVAGGCHPLDTLCATNPTFKCKRCTAPGVCSTTNIPYGGGWLQITNFSVDTQVFGVIGLNPNINMTPPYTEIGDLIGNLLGGILDQGALRLRIYDLFVVPLVVNNIVSFGFQNNAFVTTLDLPDPLCLNFLLEPGMFSPFAHSLNNIMRYEWPKSLSITDYMLENGEITEEEYKGIIEQFHKRREENFVKTFISVYETDIKGNRLGTLSEDTRFAEVRVPFRQGGVKIKLRAEIQGFYPDGTSEVKFAWKRKNGYFWYNIDGDEFYFKPITRYEEIELLAFVKQKSEPGKPPRELILASDNFPALLRIRKGTLDGEILGPEEVIGGEPVSFEIKPQVDAVYYSIDGGETWSPSIDGSRFSVRFPENLTLVELQVLLEKGEEMGFLTKFIRIEGKGRRGCGSLFGLLPIFGTIAYVLARRSTKKII
ncbi:MAG: hypothetical protein QW228_08475 [Candidatus Aenigmatarchaeota archaeon]